jgi:hypothetical protein
MRMVSSPEPWGAASAEDRACNFDVFGYGRRNWTGFWVYVFWAIRLQILCNGFQHGRFVMVSNSTSIR